MSSLAVVLLLSLGLLGAVSRGQQCDNINGVSEVVLAPSIFIGTASLIPDPSTGCAASQVSSNALACERPRIIFDGQFGPEHLDLSNREELSMFFVGWNGMNMEPYISFDMTGTPNISTIDLSVINYPNRSIGLPNFQLYTVTRANVIDPAQSDSGAVSVEFDFLNNEDFALDDSTVRNVTLRLRTPVASGFFLLRWTFTDLYNINMFAISEITMCGDAQPVFTSGELKFQGPSSENPIQILPSTEDLARRSLTVTCTISNPGSFTWQWTKDGGELPSENIRVLGADGTRTSILQITALAIDDAGVYACSASTNINPSINAGRQFDVRFPFVLEGISNVTGFIGEESVTFTCELYGYTTSTTISVMWLVNGIEVSCTALSRCTVSETAGSNQIIFFNGSVTASIISSLEIRDLRLTDQGSYICMAGSVTMTTTLTVMNILPLTFSSTTDASVTTPQPLLKDGVCSCVLTGAVSSIVTFIITALVATVPILLLLVCIHRQRPKPSPQEAVTNVETSAVYETIQNVDEAQNSHHPLEESIVTKKNESYAPCVKID